MDKIKVLIVDDEKEVLDKLKSELEKHELSIESLQRNTDAIKILKSDADIIVTAINNLTYARSQC